MYCDDVVDLLESWTLKSKRDLAPRHDIAIHPKLKTDTFLEIKN